MPLLLTTFDSKPAIQVNANISVSSVVVVTRLQVTLAREQQLAHVVVRHLQIDDLVSPATSRVVVQLNYTSWPHHGVPEHCLPLLQVISGFTFTLCQFSIFRLHRSTTYVDAVYCQRPSSVVCLSVGLSVCHTSEPCKKG